jgi:hypothetical protein
MPRLGAQEPDLREPTEAQMSVTIELLEPFSGNRMMNVSLVRKRQPNIDVREKE